MYCMPILIHISNVTLSGQCFIREFEQDNKVRTRRRTALYSFCPSVRYLGHTRFRFFMNTDHNLTLARENRKTWIHVMPSFTPQGARGSSMLAQIQHSVLFEAGFVLQAVGATRHPSHCSKHALKYWSGTHLTKCTVSLDLGRTYLK